MFPAQALAEAMLRRGWRVRLFTDARGRRYVGGFPHMTEVEQTPSATFARGSLWARALVPGQVLRGILVAWGRMRRDPPQVVAGFGGYPSIPALAAAWLLRIPRVIHEQNGVLGRVNQMFAPRVQAVGCGIWPMALPAGVKGVWVGNPVRSKVLAQAGAGYLPYGLEGTPKAAILVIGGSQGARVLSDHVPAALAALPPGLRAHLRVSHQARQEDRARVQAFYQQQAIHAEVRPFFHDLPMRMAAAQLVIARAGASSIAEIGVIGRPAILIPLAAALRDEQTANAQTLAAAGAAQMLPESQLTAATLAQGISAILGDPAQAQRMARAALSVGEPKAIEQLVALVERVAAHKSPIQNPQTEPVK